MRIVSLGAHISLRVAPRLPAGLPALEAARVPAAGHPPPGEQRGVGLGLAAGQQCDHASEPTPIMVVAEGSAAHAAAALAARTRDLRIEDQRMEDLLSLRGCGPPRNVRSAQPLFVHGCASRPSRPSRRLHAIIPIEPSIERQKNVKGIPMSKVRELEPRRKAADALDTPTDLSDEAVRDISAALNGVLADSFALYLKTKNFHWHISGPHFRDYHLLLDEQGEQIFDTTDDLAERVRKIGGTTLRSIGHIAKLQRISDNDEKFVPPLDMLRELMNDNKAVVTAMRGAHEVAGKHDDVGTTSLLETFIDDAEKRVWFLFEASHRADPTGH
jgi:starvation-inducible DNA-binding protein